jgi:hypothetical protein
MGDKKESDERISIDLDPETAVRGLLGVDPESEPAEPLPEGHDGVLTPDGEPRCMNVSPSTGKRCYLAHGHLDAHKIELS